MRKLLRLCENEAMSFAAAACSMFHEKAIPRGTSKKWMACGACPMFPQPKTQALISPGRSGVVRFIFPGPWPAKEIMEI